MVSPHRPGGEQGYFDIVGGADEAARLQPHRTRRWPESTLGEAHVGAMVRRAVATDARAAEEIRYCHQGFATHLQPGERTAEVRRWPSIHDLLDVELSLGGQS